ncbi:hypothetical protein GCM10028787_06100 [Brachybacterium horti]
MADAPHFSAVPRRDPASIGFIGVWDGTDVLARLLSKSYRLASVLDMSGEHVGGTMFNAPIVSAQRALTELESRAMTWLCHREHAAPRELTIEDYTLTNGGNERIRARLAELDIVTVYRLARQNHLAGSGEVAAFFTQWIHQRFNCYLPPTAELGEGTTFAYGGVGCVIHAKAKIGRDVKIGQNVTIGGRVRVAPPTIGDNVHIAAGARCVGGRIGSNVVAGVPAKVISTDMSGYAGYFRHAR